MSGLVPPTPPFLALLDGHPSPLLGCLRASRGPRGPDCPGKGGWAPAPPRPRLRPRRPCPSSTSRPGRPPGRCRIACSNLLWSLPSPRPGHPARAGAAGALQGDYPDLAPRRQWGSGHTPMRSHMGGSQPYSEPPTPHIIFLDDSLASIKEQRPPPLFPGVGRLHPPGDTTTMP